MTVDEPFVSSSSIQFPKVDVQIPKKDGDQISVYTRESLDVGQVVDDDTVSDSAADLIYIDIDSTIDPTPRRWVFCSGSRESSSIDS